MSNKRRRVAHGSSIVSLVPDVLKLVFSKLPYAEVPFLTAVQSDLAREARAFMTTWYTSVCIERVGEIKRVACLGTVRKIDICKSDREKHMLDVLRPIASQLCELRVRPTYEAEEWKSKDDDAKSDLVFPELLCLKFDRPPPNDDIQGLSDFLRRCPKLTQLEASISCGQIRDLAHCTDGRFAKIKSLDLECAWKYLDHVPGTHRNWSAALETMLPKFTDLVILSLSCSLLIDEEQGLLPVEPIGRACPRLRALTIDCGQYEIHIDGQWRRFPSSDWARLFPQLQYLAIVGEHESPLALPDLGTLSQLVAYDPGLSVSPTPSQVMQRFWKEMDQRLLAFLWPRDKDYPVWLVEQGSEMSWKQRQGCSDYVLEILGKELLTPTPRIDHRITIDVTRHLLIE